MRVPDRVYKGCSKSDNRARTRGDTELVAVMVIRYLNLSAGPALLSSCALY